MKADILIRRFAELADQLSKLEATKQSRSVSYGVGTFVDDHLYTNWKLKVRNLLAMACGETSEHYRTFVELEKPAMYSTNYETMQQVKAVFEAAREDYEGGYCNSLRNLVQAEVFGNELEQAGELLAAGYRTPAAVVAGVVLETTLRELCGKRGIGSGKLDRMNAELAKAGQYNVLVQKQITAHADIRNNAAHGHPEKFTDDDVRNMIAWVEDFVVAQL